MRSVLLTLHDPQVAREFYDAGLWQDDTMYAVLCRHADERPDAYAVQDRRYRLTWREYRDWVDAVACDLHLAGLRTGDRVAVWLPNRVESLVTFMACSRNGYIAVLSLHQNHTTADVLTLLDYCQVAAFVGQPGYGADSGRHDIFAVLAEKNTLRRVYMLPPPDEAGIELVPGSLPFPDQEAKPATLPPVDDNADKVSYIAFTSGTTGRPKALMHSDNTLLANGRAIVHDWGQNGKTIIYCMGPLSHHLAMIGVEVAMAGGCEYVTNDLARGMNPLDRILETRATYVMGVPTHAIDIQAEAHRRGMKRIGSVTVFYMSGASIPTEVARRFLDYGIVPQNTYGMSEGGSHTSTLPTDTLDVMVRTVGQTCGRGNPCYELRVWKQSNRDELADPGEVGELGGRGASLMLGYFGNAEATRKSFNAHGWFMSGDLARMDTDGNIEMIGRTKDLIIRGGHNIYPVEIEDLMLRHMQVIKAAAFPVDDKRLGEKVCLAILWTGDPAPDAEQILLFLAEQGLSKYDMPEYLLVMDSFPMTASGKILKRQLVEDVRSGVLQPQSVRYRPARQEV